MITVILIAAVVACVYLIPRNNIQVSISAPINKENSSYIYMIGFGGIPEDLKSSEKENLNMVINDLNEFHSTFTSEHEKPYYVEAKYENIDKKTVITFKGEVTDKETGKLVEFNKVFTYDFFITYKINTDGKDLKYFK